MRWNGFRGGIAFAAAAALGVVPLAAIAAPFLGWYDALSAYAIAACSAYLFGIAGSFRQGAAASVAAGALASLIALIAPTLGDAVLGAALALGLCRSGMLYQARFARALLLESLLLFVGLGLAATLFTGTLFSAVLATWSFFLIQSAFFLVGGVAPSQEPTDDLDPFEAAHSRALELLDHGGVGEP